LFLGSRKGHVLCFLPFLAEQKTGQSVPGSFLNISGDLEAFSLNLIFIDEMVKVNDFAISLLLVGIFIKRTWEKAAA